ncbi:MULTISPECIES: CRISPR system precrRNA processing endoribonuclease RAMP protein Cas6 [Thermodesulfobacterium]|jgi:CRISPR-associated endoribonuclease Cas6|uniref:CRISPR-associated protein Cas6 n=1 Tax=Thermodesulfobacterium commune TaxID=1741 RepID=A0A3B8N5W6_9BACT|nr:CRISPR system precrRNA processing endoribonuclease RAMP protein Cas6 [Thermodesulfobacterium sp.]HAA83648.1 CRISPR-associated protein Cas6 [Thermodesulfobacterium commune]MBZ4682401.1 system precrRNA processing endoribonuclease protein Cas6 [Thermodesulfobacterium sp.]MDK2861553.1 hypothetical protein [Thermodesulfobacterium sp.]MDN5380424.1 hypothetical protein [Thermodesulfobacterium sp.]HBT03748.1 CRISPR-associated protein Cas6 [Thermodesulfobacterium commune]
MIKIPYRNLTFVCEPKDELYLPEFKGSSFRGVIGRALRSALCTLKTMSDCHECPLFKTCYYAYIFETIPDKTTPLPFNLHKYPSLPHPFVIEPPETDKKIFAKGDRFDLKVILIGKAINYTPHFILAIQLAGENGIGKGKRKFNLLEHLIEDGEIAINFLLNLQETEGPFSSETQITIEFLTPLRLIYQKKLVKRLEFHVLIRQLLRRITSLYYFHCEGNTKSIPARELISLAEKIKTKHHGLRWYDWERYSFRKERRMQMGGLIGKVVFEGNLSPFTPILKAGEILHCGKNTSFGLGKYRIVEEEV